MARYDAGNTGWDIGYPAPALTAYFEALEDKDISILVPGCGNGHEVVWLAEHDFRDVTAVDLVAAPLARIRQRTGDRIRTLQADFFDLTGRYDLIMEQTFFCALDPELREQYVRKMHALLKPGGRLVGLLFNTEFEKEGPPFGGFEDTYRELFSPWFDILRMEPTPLSIPPRRGRELFVEMRPKPKNGVAV